MRIYFTDLCHLILDHEENGIFGSLAEFATTLKVESGADGASRIREVE